MKINEVVPDQTLNKFACLIRYLEIDPDVAAGYTRAELREELKQQGINIDELDEKLKALDPSILELPKPRLSDFKLTIASSAIRGADPNQPWIAFSWIFDAARQLRLKLDCNQSTTILEQTLDGQPDNTPVYWNDDLNDQEAFTFQEGRSVLSDVNVQMIARDFDQFPLEFRWWTSRPVQPQPESVQQPVAPAASPQSPPILAQLWTWLSKMRDAFNIPQWSTPAVAMLSVILVVGTLVVERLIVPSPSTNLGPMMGSNQPDVPPSTSTALKRSQDEWLRDIFEMIVSGKIDDAIKELHAFQKAYPDYKPSVENQQ